MKPKEYKVIKNTPIMCKGDIVKIGEGDFYYYDSIAVYEPEKHPDILSPLTLITEDGIGVYKGEECYYAYINKKIGKDHRCSHMLIKRKCKGKSKVAKYFYHKHNADAYIHSEIRDLLIDEATAKRFVKGSIIRMLTGFKYKISADAWEYKDGNLSMPVALDNINKGFIPILNKHKGWIAKVNSIPKKWVIITKSAEASYWYKDKINHLYLVEIKDDTPEGNYIVIENSMFRGNLMETDDCRDATLPEIEAWEKGFKIGDKVWSKKSGEYLGVIKKLLTTSQQGHTMASGLSKSYDSWLYFIDLITKEKPEKPISDTEILDWLEIRHDKLREFVKGMIKKK